MDTTARIPATPRLCFNWLPTYRYGLFAYKALQQLSAHALREGANGLELAGTESSKGIIRPIAYVRPVAMESVRYGYLRNELSESTERFSNGKHYLPLSDDTALIVAKDTTLGKALVNNVLPYMISAPSSVTALSAVAGGYTAMTDAELDAAHNERGASAAKLTAEISAMYNHPADKIMMHLNAAGGLIEGTVRYFARTKPNFTTCSLAPEYWDFMRLIITYSAANLRLVKGRDDEQFPTDSWLSAVSRTDNDLVYLSHCSNPVGRTMPEDVFRATLDAIPAEPLFFIDCTSIDTTNPMTAARIQRILKDYAHKNIAIIKSFSKDYDLGELRVAYALFTKKETKDAIFKFGEGHPTLRATKTALTALKDGTYERINGGYLEANSMLRALEAKYPTYKFTGTCSNYTLVISPDEAKAVALKQKVHAMFGGKIYPGEMPMQGGGDMGLGKDEIDLTTMKDIPFLSRTALRFVVTKDAMTALGAALAEV